MVKRILISSCTLVSVFFIHIAYTVYNAAEIAKKWVFNIQVVNGNQNFFQNYFSNQDYFIGLSFAFALAFTVYAILRYLEARKKSTSGILGGITLTGALYAGICFFTGCCGSPMLAVYLGFFGAAFLGFIKPLSFILTVASIAIGIIMMEFKNNKKCASDCDCISDNLQNEQER